MGNLHNQVNDEILYQHFQPFGNISSVSVKKNHFTGDSRGFGFVNYKDAKGAEEGKNSMNHGKIMGRELRICIKRDLSKLPQDANLYVKNISKEVSGKILEDEFIKYGDIFCCAVRYDEENNHLGYAYVQFECVDDALKALEELNGKDLSGKSIIVEKFLPKSKRQTTSFRTNVFLKEFPASWDKTSDARVQKFIDEVCSTYGEITSSYIKFNEKHNNHIAFVCYKEQSEAEAAIEALSGMDLDGTPLFAAFFQKQHLRKKTQSEKFAKSQNDTNLFIKSIKSDVTED